MDFFVNFLMSTILAEERSEYTIMTAVTQAALLLLVCVLPFLLASRLFVFLLVRTPSARGRLLWLAAGALLVAAYSESVRTGCYVLVERPCTADPTLCEAVDVRGDLTAATLRTLYESRGLPVVMAGLLAPEVAGGGFRPARLAKRMGLRGTNVTVQCGAVEQGDTELMRDVPFRDFLVQAMGEGDGAGADARASYCDAAYVAELPLGESGMSAELAEEVEGLLARVSTPAVRGLLDSTFRFWWAGGGGVRTGLHIDPPDSINVLHHLYGIKDVW